MSGPTEAGASTAELSRLGPGALTRLLARLVEAPPPEVDLPGPVAGDTLGRFRLEREIGRGGFGRVFRATDLELGREVAVKLLHPERGGGTPVSEWVQREAEAAAQLRHRGIVTLHDAGRWEGGAFLVYELLRGETLAARIQRGRLPRPEARRILGELAAALAHAHAAGVVHRDVKPANVFLEEDGAVKLLDLGLAQVAGAIGLAAGSPRFMAPEQGRGAAADARADVFAWGVLAGLLLDGEIPPLEPGLPPPSAGSLRALARWARAVDPAGRPAGAGALVEALARLETRRRRLGLARAGLLVAGLAGVFSLPALLRTAGPPPAPLKVAVADAEGDAGAALRDALSAEVARGLGGTPRLEVIGRARLLAVLRATGRAAEDGLGARDAAFAADQVGCAAVVVPAARRAGDGVVLSLEARPPAGGEPLARVEAALPGAGAAPGAALGGLVAPLVAALEARGREAGAGEAAVARAVTATLEAQRRHEAGLRCEEAPSRGERWSKLDCARHYQEALAFDPDFPLAHFALARGAMMAGESTEALQAALRPALERIGRVPPRERAMLRAWQASLDGRDEEAVATLRGAVADWPGDARLTFALGQALEGQGRLAEAVEPLTRTVELDPGLEAAAALLVWTLGRLDRVEALRALAARLAALPPYPGRLHAEVEARGWAGDVEGALRVARQGAAGGPAAREDLLEALVAAGRLAEAEALLGDAARRAGSQEERQLAVLRYLAGRRREALAVLDRPLPAGAGAQARFIADARRAWRLAERRDGAGIALLAERIRPHSVELAASLAPVMAYGGALEPALALAPSMAGQPGTRRILDALVAWRRAGAAAALPGLRWAAGGEGLDVTEVFPPEAPAWLAAECALEAGEGERALADLRRFQRTYRPLGPWRMWAWPRSLYLEARLLDDLGRRAEARAALARLEALWARADPDLPLVAEMRALRRRLGAGG